MNGGIVKTCSPNQGGIKKVYITGDFSNIQGLTLASPGGQISTITMAMGTLFYEFEFLKNSSTWDEASAGTPAVGSQSFTQTITIVLARREKTKRDKIQLLTGYKPVGIIVEDKNGVFWMPGETNGCTLTEIKSPSGTNPTDGNNYTLVFTADEPALANEVLSSAVTAVI